MRLRPNTYFLLLSVLLVSLILFPPDVRAQASSTIAGNIQDEEGQPVIGASVVVYDDESETSMVEGRSSDADGAFEIEMDPGQYFLKITFVSYEGYGTPFELQAGEVNDLGIIELSYSTSHLDEVSVEARRSHMEMNFDNRTFHVQEDITSMGGSALDVLDNVPSLATDFEGNVSLRGNEGVRILINGRPSNLVRDGTDGLDAIPAEMIRQVEVITNPSARYEAEGSGGIINIVLVDGAQLGFNGSVTARTGIPHDHRLSGNFNYHGNNINWFLGTNIRYRDRPRGSEIFQHSTTADTSYMYRQNSETIRTNRRGRIRFGADVYLPADQILTATAHINLQDNANTSDVAYTDYTDGNEVIRRIHREDIEDEQDNRYNFRLEYENRFHGDGHRLTADASFGFDREQEYSNLTQTIEQGSGNVPDQRTDNFEQNTDYRLQADYERPLGGDGKFEAGFRSSMEWMRNDYTVDERQDGSWTTIPAYNDNFRYSEMINAGYGIYSGQGGPFTWQLGLRAEQTSVSTELALADEAAENSYFDLFPSVFLTWQVGDQSSLQASYSKRLSRPRSRWLLPFAGYADSRNIFRGNPGLEPEFSNSVETGYLRHWETGSLLTSVYYRHRTGVIEHITSQEQNPAGDPVTVRYPINLATEEAWGIEFTADQELLENLQLSGSLNIYQSESEGTHEGELLTSQTESFMSRMRVRWQFHDGWNFNSNLIYRGPRTTTQGRREASRFINMGVARELFDRSVTVSLNIRDLLNSRRNDTIIDEPGFYSERTSNWSTRSVRLNLRYRF